MNHIYPLSCLSDTTEFVTQCYHHTQMGVTSTFCNFGDHRCQCKPSATRCSCEQRGRETENIISQRNAESAGEVWTSFSDGQSHDLLSSPLKAGAHAMELVMNKRKTTSEHEMKTWRVFLTPQSACISEFIFNFYNLFITSYCSVQYSILPRVFIFTPQQLSVYLIIDQFRFFINGLCRL